MAGNKIQLKRTSVAGRVPSNLDVGELAINLADNRLFTADGSNTIIDVHGQSLNTTANVTFRDGAFANITANVIGATTITGNVDWSYITSKPDLKIDITGDVTGNNTFTDLANGSINVTLPNTAVTAGTYGNSSAIPVITVDGKGRITSATTNTVAGVTGFAYTTANNTLSITTGSGSTYSANINTITSPTITNGTLNGNTTIAAVIANGTVGVAGQILTTNGSAVYWNNAPATSLDAVLAVGNTTTKALTVGPLTVGTGNTSLGNTTITGSANVTTTLQVTGAATFSNTVSIAGNLTGSAANVTIVAGSFSTIFANNGSTTFPGAVSGITTLSAGNTSITGNLTVTSGTTSLGNTVIAGNLVVTGATTYVNTNIFQVSDNIITLNADAAGTPTDNVGFEVNRGTSANTSLLWDESIDKWTFTNDGTAYFKIASNTDVDTAYTNAIAYAASNTYVNTTFAPLAGAAFTGNVTFNANVTFSNTRISSNGGVGTAGQVLTSGGAADEMYWSTIVSGNSFGRIAVAGQTNISADAATDTLTFAAGNNIIITTDPSTDTITITASGGGGNNTLSSQFFITSYETFTANGTATTFTLAQEAKHEYAFVAVDGLIQKYSDHYTFDGTSLVFVTAPVSGEIVSVYHIANDEQTTETTAAIAAIDTFTANGTSNSFTLSVDGADNTTLVLVDGQLQVYTTDYTISGTTLQFDAAPTVNSSIAAVHLSSTVYGYNMSTDAFVGDGSTASYTTSRNGTQYNCLVLVDGIVQKYTTDYTFAGNVITFNENIGLNEEVEVLFFINSQAKKTNSLAYTGNGSNTAFTLPSATDAENILVYVNGLYYHPGEDYYVSGNQLSFYTAPINSAKIRVRQIR